MNDTKSESLSRTPSASSTELQPQDFHPTKSQLSTEIPTLLVDFSWRKFSSMIKADDGNMTPLYTAVYKKSKPTLHFSTLPDDNEFAIGKIHIVHIHADCNIRGKDMQIRALKRWRTKYTHLSDALSTDGKPVVVKWSTACSMKTWDFICSDEQGDPVAKYSANIWGVKKVGKFEFMKTKPGIDPVKLRDEIVVTGMTLFYCMMLRANSLVSFFSAFFASTGPIKQDEEKPIEGTSGVPNVAAVSGGAASSTVAPVAGGKS